MKKRTLAVALVCAMICSLLGGIAFAENTEPVTINWYRVTWHSNVDEELVENAINEYIEPLIGVNVNIMNDAESTALDLALAAGEDIDLFFTASWNGGYNYINGNIAMDVTDLLQDYPTLYEAIPENVWEAAKIGGRNYYLPIYKESAVGAGVATAQRFIDQFGWDVSSVKELADLTPFLQDAADNGFEWAWNGSDYFNTVALDTFAFIKHYIGVRLEDGASEVINVFDTPEYRDYLALKHSWNEAGFINAENLGYIHDNNIATMWQDNQNAFTGWTLTPDNNANASARFGEPTVVIPLTKCYVTTDGPFGSAYMVNAKTPDYDAALKFVGLLFTDEKVADLACYGIEDKHYSIDADGRVNLIPDSGYSYTGVWAVTSVMAPTLMVGESENKKEEYSEFNANAPVSKLAGFLFDESNVSAEIAALEGVVSEYELLMNHGFYDPDEYLDEYLAALDSAGINTVIAEAQAQYDAWRAVK